jgi:hypothetical protein
VYFGDSLDAVTGADTGSPEFKGNQAGVTFPAANLSSGKTYYWRIDEHDGSEVHVGDVWSFTTQPFIKIVDWFEDYDNAANPIADTWIDVWRNVSLETGAVHDGSKAMRFGYQNQFSPYYAEATRTFGTTEDWTIAGAKVLALWFYGDVNNVAEQMYVRITDSANHVGIVMHPDPASVTNAEWQWWTIALQDFTNQGVNLAAVRKIAIRLGDGVNSGQPSSDFDHVIVDGILLYPQICRPEYGPVGDLTGDCIVNLYDVDALVAEWLVTTDFADFATLASSWLEEQLWP